MRRCLDGDYKGTPKYLEVGGVCRIDMQFPARGPRFRGGHPEEAERKGKAENQHHFEIFNKSPAGSCHKAVLPAFERIGIISRGEQRQKKKYQGGERDFEGKTIIRFSAAPARVDFHCKGHHIRHQ